MKRIISILLALVMLSAVAACGGTPSTSEAPPSPPAEPSASASGEPSQPPQSSTPADAPPAGAPDYSAASGFALSADSFPDRSTPYKFVFVSNQWDQTVAYVEEGFEFYAKQVGSTCEAVQSDSDADKLIRNVENYIVKGYDGFFINVMPSTSGRVAEICDENDVIWSAVSGIPRDNDDVVIAPYVEVNNTVVGTQLTDEAVAWAKNNLDGFNEAEAMVLILDLSGAEELHARSVAMEARAKEIVPGAKLELADTIAESTGAFDNELSYNMVSRRLAANPGVKYWIILGPFDYLSVGCVRAVEEYGVDGNTVVASCNGDLYIPLLEEGTSSAWRFCLYWDMAVMAKYLFFGLYARVSGAVEGPELWPDFVKPGEPNAGLQMKAVIMDPSNYEDILGYIDNVTGLSHYNKQWTSGTEYELLDFS
ncbi:MAG: substrate-binding domain-containing protein [Oscillospiraceae bacterium]|jgi:ABC-type sugar transport system substrate-binding protein|nr:substrate-binding domain-containing protein [Oscillospiraceae bacterium]